MRGFLLGLANGTVCIASCAPVIIPYILGEGKSVRHNAVVLGQFLAGRLLGYLCFALLAWMTGVIILQNFAHQQIILGIAYIVLGGLLLIYSFVKPKKRCAVNASPSSLEVVAAKWPTLLPICFGVLTGLNLCPPFLLIFTEAASAESLGRSLFFFWAFFLGTSIYFIPFTFLGFLKRFPQLRTIGRMTAILIALYYLYVGVMTIVSCHTTISG
jgi:hypothetical protein